MVVETQAPAQAQREGEDDEKGSETEPHTPHEPAHEQGALGPESEPREETLVSVPKDAADNAELEPEPEPEPEPGPEPEPETLVLVSKDVGADSAGVAPEPKPAPREETLVSVPKDAADDAELEPEPEPELESDSREETLVLMSHMPHEPALEQGALRPESEPREETLVSVPKDAADNAELELEPEPEPEPEPETLVLVSKDVGDDSADVAPELKPAPREETLVSVPKDAADNAELEPEPEPELESDPREETLMSVSKGTGGEAFQLGAAVETTSPAPPQPTRATRAASPVSLLSRMGDDAGRSEDEVPQTVGLRSDAFGSGESDDKTKMDAPTPECAKTTSADVELGDVELDVLDEQKPLLEMPLQRRNSNDMLSPLQLLRLDNSNPGLDVTTTDGLPGSNRLSCCGYEPDPVMVTVILAQLLHVAVGVLLWICFWRRLCLASFCYAGVMVYYGLFPAHSVPAVDYMKQYMENGRPGRRYLENYLTGKYYKNKGNNRTDAHKMPSALQSAPRALLFGIGIAFVALVVHCVLLGLGVGDEVDVSAFNRSAEVWHKRRVRIGMLPPPATSLLSAISPDIAMLVVGCFLLGLHARLRVCADRWKQHVPMESHSPHMAASEDPVVGLQRNTAEEIVHRLSRTSFKPLDQAHPSDEGWKVYLGDVNSKDTSLYEVSRRLKREPTQEHAEHRERIVAERKAVEQKIENAKAATAARDELQAAEAEHQVADDEYHEAIRSTALVAEADAVVAESDLNMDDSAVSHTKRLEYLAAELEVAAGKLKAAEEKHHDLVAANLAAEDFVEAETEYRKLQDEERTMKKTIDDEGEKNHLDPSRTALWCVEIGRWIPVRYLLHEQMPNHCCRQSILKRVTGRESWTETKKYMRVHYRMLQMFFFNVAKRAPSESCAVASFLLAIDYKNSPGAIPYYLYLILWLQAVHKQGYMEHGRIPILHQSIFCYALCELVVCYAGRPGTLLGVGADEMARWVDRATWLDASGLFAAEWTGSQWRVVLRVLIVGSLLLRTIFDLMNLENLVEQVEKYHQRLDRLFTFFAKIDQSNGPSCLSVVSFVIALEYIHNSPYEISGDLPEHLRHDWQDQQQRYENVYKILARRHTLDESSFSSLLQSHRVFMDYVEAWVFMNDTDPEKLTDPSCAEFYHPNERGKHLQDHMAESSCDLHYAHAKIKTFLMNNDSSRTAPEPEIPSLTEFSLEELKEKLESRLIEEIAHAGTSKRVELTVKVSEETSIRGVVDHLHDLKETAEFSKEQKNEQMQNIELFSPGMSAWKPLGNMGYDLNEIFQSSENCEQQFRRTGMIGVCIDCVDAVAVFSFSKAYVVLLTVWSATSFNCITSPILAALAGYCTLVSSDNNGGLHLLLLQLLGLIQWLHGFCGVEFPALKDYTASWSPDTDAPAGPVTQQLFAGSCAFVLHFRYSERGVQTRDLHRLLKQMRKLRKVSHQIACVVLIICGVVKATAATLFYLCAGIGMLVTQAAQRYDVWYGIFVVALVIVIIKTAIYPLPAPAFEKWTSDDAAENWNSWIQLLGLRGCPQVQIVQATDGSDSSDDFEETTDCKVSTMLASYVVLGSAGIQYWWRHVEEDAGQMLETEESERQKSKTQRWQRPWRATFQRCIFFAMLFSNIAAVLWRSAPRYIDVAVISAMLLYLPFHLLLAGDYGQEKKESQTKELLSSIKAEVGAKMPDMKDATSTLKRTFRAIDLDGDGCIDYAQFAEFLRQLGARVSHEDVELLTQMLDTDADGTIDLDGFVAWFRRGQNTGQMFLARLWAVGPGLLIVTTVLVQYAATRDQLSCFLLSHFMDKHSSEICPLVFTSHGSCNIEQLQLCIEDNDGCLRYTSNSTTGVFDCVLTVTEAGLDNAMNTSTWSTAAWLFSALWNTVLAIQVHMSIIARSERQQVDNPKVADKESTIDSPRRDSTDTTHACQAWCCKALDFFYAKARLVRAFCVMMAPNTVLMAVYNASQAGFSADVNLIGFGYFGFLLLLLPQPSRILQCGLPCCRTTIALWVPLLVYSSIAFVLQYVWQLQFFADQRAEQGWASLVGLSDLHADDDAMTENVDESSTVNFQHPAVRIHIWVIMSICLVRTQASARQRTRLFEELFCGRLWTDDAEDRVNYRIDNRTKYKIRVKSDPIQTDSQGGWWFFCEQKGFIKEIEANEHFSSEEAAKADSSATENRVLVSRTILHVSIVTNDDQQPKKTVGHNDVEWQDIKPDQEATVILTQHREPVVTIVAGANDEDSIRIRLNCPSVELEAFNGIKTRLPLPPHGAWLHMSKDDVCQFGKVKFAAINFLDIYGQFLRWLTLLIAAISSSYSLSFLYLLSLAEMTVQGRAKRLLFSRVALYVIMLFYLIVFMILLLHKASGLCADKWVNICNEIREVSQTLVHISNADANTAGWYDIVHGAPVDIQGFLALLVGGNILSSDCDTRRRIQKLHQHEMKIARNTKKSITTDVAWLTRALARMFFLSDVDMHSAFASSSNSADSRRARVRRCIGWSSTTLPFSRAVSDSLLTSRGVVDRTQFRDTLIEQIKMTRGYTELLESIDGGVTQEDKELDEATKTQRLDDIVNTIAEEFRFPGVLQTVQILDLSARRLRTVDVIPGKSDYDVVLPESVTSFTVCPIAHKYTALKLTTLDEECDLVPNKEHPCEIHFVGNTAIFAIGVDYWHEDGLSHGAVAGVTVRRGATTDSPSPSLSSPNGADSRRSEEVVLRGFCQKKKNNIGHMAWRDRHVRIKGTGLFVYEDDEQDEPRLSSIRNVIGYQVSVYDDRERHTWHHLVLRHEDRPSVLLRFEEKRRRDEFKTALENLSQGLPWKGVSEERDPEPLPELEAEAERQEPQQSEPQQPEPKQELRLELELETELEPGTIMATMTESERDPEPETVTEPETEPEPEITTNIGETINVDPVVASAGEGSVPLDEATALLHARVSTSSHNLNEDGIAGDTRYKVRWIALQAILSPRVVTKIYQRTHIPDLFSMGQRVELPNGLVRPPCGLNLNPIRLAETLVWQFFPDFLGALVLAIALSDLGSASCVWLGYIGMTLYLLFISHEIVESKIYHKVSHMRRVLTMLRIYNFAHLTIQCVYLLAQALWNKACLQDVDSGECGCGGGSPCCVYVGRVCTRKQSFLDSMLGVDTEGAALDEPDQIGKLLGLSTSTDRERANFTCGGVLMIIFWFAKVAMSQPAFDRHDGGAIYYQEREWQRARSRKFVSLVRRVQIRSASIQKLWSSTQYINSLMDRLDNEGSASARPGGSRKVDRKDVSIWGIDSSNESTRTGSEIKSVKVTAPRIPGTNCWEGTYYPVATLDGTVFREPWSLCEILLHPGAKDKISPCDKRAAGFDHLHEKDRWIIRKVGLGGHEDIDYFVAPVASAKTQSPDSVPWDNKKWQTAEWSSEHPNWDGPKLHPQSFENDQHDPAGKRRLVTVTVAGSCCGSGSSSSSEAVQNEKWQQAIERIIVCFCVAKARDAMKAKFGHLTGKWVEPMLDLKRLSYSDVFYLVMQHMYMLHVSQIAQVLIVVHMLSQYDWLAMPMFVSLFLYANMHYPNVRSGFWLSAIVWIVFEIVLRFVLLLEFDLGDWRSTCNSIYEEKEYSALSNCALVDDSAYHFYLVLLLFSLLHTRESLRRRGEWRETSTCILLTSSFSFFLVALVVQQGYLSVLIPVLVVIFSATMFKTIPTCESKEQQGTDHSDKQDRLKQKSSVVQCDYCAAYLRKPNMDRVQHLLSQHLLSNDKPCLYRVTPQNKLKRVKLCMVCGSPTIRPVTWTDKDPVRELAHPRPDARQRHPDMIVVHVTFCPTILARHYDGQKAANGREEIQGCTNNGQKMVERAFVWASVVEEKTQAVMIVEPTEAFYKAGPDDESQNDEKKRMEQYLEDHIKQYQMDLLAAFGAPPARKTGWPEVLVSPEYENPEKLKPTKVHIVRKHGSISRFDRVIMDKDKKKRIVQKSRMQLRHTFDTELRDMLPSQRNSAETPALPLIHFGYPNATAKWRITAYIRVFCKDPQYTDDPTLSDLVDRCRANPKRSRFVRLVPRSLVIANETDTLEPNALGQDNQTWSPTGHWTPLCEISCNHSAITAATCALVEKTVWQYINTHKYLPPGGTDSREAVVVDNNCSEGLSGLQFIVDDCIRDEVKRRYALLNELETNKAFEMRHTIYRTNQQIDELQPAPLQYIALAKQEFAHFYEQYWLRDASVQRLEKQISGQNKNPIRTICREAEAELKSQHPSKSGDTYATAVELLIDNEELQKDMTAFLLERLRSAAGKLQELHFAKLRNKSYEEAEELIDAAIRVHKYLEYCSKHVAEPYLESDQKSDQNFMEELHANRNCIEASEEAGNFSESERVFSISEPEIELAQHLNQTWGVAKADIQLEGRGIKKGDILVRVVNDSSPSPENGKGEQQLRVEYHIPKNSARQTHRYEHFDSPLSYHLDADQVQRQVEFLPRPQAMRVIHDFYAKNPAQLGWCDRSISGSHGKVRAGSIVIVIDQEPTCPWTVGFLASDPSMLGEIPSSFIATTPKLPDFSEGISEADLLPSQRAMRDFKEESESVVDEEGFSGQPSLRDFEQDFGAFPSLHSDGVDHYTRAFLCEMSCLCVGVVVYANAFGIALGLSIAEQADAGDSAFYLFVLLVVQFVFIMADRAAYLTQSIRAKIVLLWLSFIVYMTLFFGAFSEYTKPACTESASASAFCDPNAQSASSPVAQIISSIFGLIACVMMRWMLLSVSRSMDGYFSIMGDTISHVMWGGLLTADDLTAIIRTLESLCYVSLFSTLLSRDRALSFSQVLFFCLKTYYWYLSAEQIRYGYKLEAGKLSEQLLTSKTTMLHQYLYVVWTNFPFLNEIRVAWDWTWSRTTLEYYDAVKLDQMQKFTYLAHCRLQRLNEIGRKLGKPQFGGYKLGYGVVFVVIFTACLWGPMLLFVSSYEFYTYNVYDASLTVDLQLNRLSEQLGKFTLHETIPMEVGEVDGSTQLFTDAAEQLTGDSSDLKQMYAEFGDANTFWTRENTYVEQIQSIAIGLYPSQSWQSTMHTRRQIVSDLNATLAAKDIGDIDVARNSAQCGNSGTACLIFTLTFKKGKVGDHLSTSLPQLTLEFPEQIVLGYETIKGLVDAINATVTSDQSEANIHLHIENAFLPLMILKYDGTPDALSSNTRIPLVLALHSDEGSSEWYWTVTEHGSIGGRLLDHDFFRRKHCGGLTEEQCRETWGLCLAVLNDRYPVDDTGLGILELGIFVIYGSFIYAVASAYKLWTYKTMRDILLTDMDRVHFLWGKIQGVNTARALAKRNTDYFMVEEKLWWDLHSIFRDPAKLYGASPKLPRSLLLLLLLFSAEMGVIDSAPAAKC